MQWLRLYHDTINDPKWRLVSNESGQPVGNVLAVWMSMLINASGSSTRGTLEDWQDRYVAAHLGYPTDAVRAIREAMQGVVLDGDRLSGWDKRQMASDTSAERMRRMRAKTAQNDGGGGGDGGGTAQKPNGAYNRHSDGDVTADFENVTSQTGTVTSPHLARQTEEYHTGDYIPLHTPDEPIAAPIGAAGEKVAFVGSTFKFSGKTLADLAERYPAIPNLTKTLGAYDVALAGRPNAYGELHVKLLHENNYHSTHAARRSAPSPMKPSVSPASQDRTGVPNALKARRAVRHG